MNPLNTELRSAIKSAAAMAVHPCSALTPIPPPHYFYRSAGPIGPAFVRPVLSSFNLVVAARAHIYPKHRHLNYQLIFAEHGTYECTLNGAPLTLRPRDVLVVKRGDWHEDICARGLRYLAINFDLDGSKVRSEDLLFSRDVLPNHQVIRGPNESVWSIIDRMLEESSRTDHVVAHVQNALLLELLWILVRSLPSHCLSPMFLQHSAAQAFNDLLLRLFDRHVADNLSTEQIAAEMDMSVRTLTKRCQDVLGKPPGRAFMHNKMEYAALCLRQSEISVKELSHTLGFQNQYHFSRVFHRYLGSPPSAYRRMPK